MQAELSAGEGRSAIPSGRSSRVVGGAKVSTKLELLGNLIPKVDSIVIGGGMANTFLAAQGRGRQVAVRARHGRYGARDHGRRKRRLHRWSAGRRRSSRASSRRAARARSSRPMPARGQDDSRCRPGLSPASPRSLPIARTLVWNGPLGAFEIPPFNEATDAAARQAALLTRAGKLLSVAAAATRSQPSASGSADSFTYVSRQPGGAFRNGSKARPCPALPRSTKPEPANRNSQ